MSSLWLVVDEEELAFALASQHRTYGRGGDELATVQYAWSDSGPARTRVHAGEEDAQGAQASARPRLPVVGHHDALAHVRVLELSTNRGSWQAPLLLGGGIDDSDCSAPDIVLIAVVRRSFRWLQSVLRVWDCFLLEGGEFVLVVSFWLIKMNEMPINNAQSMAELMSLFSTVPRRLFDSDRLIKGAIKYAALFEDKQEISSLYVCATRFVARLITCSPHRYFVT